ncbi:hypothetical protein RvY_05723 [Ramazzottius varieornatus]|uniref:Uncharacterized protein n=1 Tax=Ramazzottius varieornatus TaxID=947166 RepID=A0A1D1V1L9_RAMVA|nr:hypothetical protein RvY_05723 [Ramazzottius varieornatus]
MNIVHYGTASNILHQLDVKADPNCQPIFNKPLGRSQNPDCASGPCDE